MNDTLLRLVYARLDRDGAVDEPWAELGMAACEGKAGFDAEQRRVANFIEFVAAGRGATASPRRVRRPSGISTGIEN